MARLVSISVLTIQKGLAVFHAPPPGFADQVRRQFPRGVPSPGAVDGRWGVTTRGALFSFIVGGVPDSQMEAARAEVHRLTAQWPATTPVAAITLEVNAATALSSAAQLYGRSGVGTGGSAPRSSAPQDPSDPSGTVSQLRDEARQILDQGASQARSALPVYGAAMAAGQFPWGAVLLGLGAAVLVVGGGYWLYTSR